MSTHAGNPVLICLEPLYETQLLSPREQSAYEDCLTYKRHCIGEAWATLSQQEDHDWLTSFQLFCEQQQHWLHDYALYISLKTTHEHRAWNDWPEPYRNRDTKALKDYYSENAHHVDSIKFEQYLFFSQWLALKQYANAREVLLYGDLPIFVAYDSADVWCHREMFLLDDQGAPSVVAGVPPDYFSETGQRWGNPLYDWSQMETANFDWWIERLTTQLHLFDRIRIDHFRGFEAYWEIPAHEETAVNGCWRKAPGEKLFNRLKQHFGSPLPLIAEDLGVITDEVTVLRKHFGLPGMKILQFAFDGNCDNPYLPHKHTRNSVVFTGTHDNNTTLGWYQELSDEQQRIISEYLYHSPDPIHWLLIATAMASVAETCIIPMQDVLGLDGRHRMNVPGTTEGNWGWRFDWHQLGHTEKQKLRGITQMYQRHR